MPMKIQTSNPINRMPKISSLLHAVWLGHTKPYLGEILGPQALTLKLRGGSIPSAQHKVSGAKRSHCRKYNLDCLKEAYIFQYNPKF